MLLVNNISINTAIIHRLDNQENELEKSDFILSLNNDIKSVLTTHASSGLNDKKVRFAKFVSYPTNHVYSLTSKYLSGEKVFLEYSHQIADSLFSYMGSKTISAGDLAVVDMNIDGDRYIALLKLDYKDQYLSQVETIDDKKKITLIKTDNAWPEEGTRLQKAAFIRLNMDIDNQSSFDLVMLDRQHTQKSIEDDSASIFFSRNFLNVKLIEDETTNTNAFIRGAKAITSEYKTLNISPKKAYEIYNHAVSIMRGSNNINIDNFIEGFFDPENEEKEQFDNAKKIFNEAGLTRSEFTKSDEVAQAFLRNRRFTMDGIRLTVDDTVFEDPDKFSHTIFTNPDGTKLINVEIKGVELKKME